MESSASTRIWRTIKGAGRPIPRWSDDDYIDYCVTEAIYLKVAKEDKEAREKAEEESKVEQWKADRKDGLHESV